MFKIPRKYYVHTWGLVKWAFGPCNTMIDGVLQHLPYAGLHRYGSKILDEYTTTLYQNHYRDSLGCPDDCLKRVIQIRIGWVFRLRGVLNCFINWIILQCLHPPRTVETGE